MIGKQEDTTNINGVLVYYYFICKRKVWLFNRKIQLESEDENVMIGKLIDENTYLREKKHILIDETINVDFIKNWKVLHEIKKSKSIEEASIWQLKYYLYFLKKRKIEVEKGILDYPNLKTRKEVFLLDDDVKTIEKILKEIMRIISLEKIPKVEKKKICKNCAYFEYCFI